MTVSTITNKVVYTGDGATTVFPYLFLVPDADNVRVIITDSDGVDTDLTPAEYDITGIGSDLFGSVTYPKGGIGTPLPVGSYITIDRQMELTQEIEFPNQQGIYPEVIEEAVDKLTMIAQQLQDELGRSLQASISEDEIGNLPPVAARAGKALGFDALGQPIALTTDPLSVTSSDIQDSTLTGRSVLTVVSMPALRRLLRTDVADPYDFGATNPTSDNSAAFAAALHSTTGMSAYGQSVLYIPPGANWRLDSPITVDYPYTIEGDSMSTSVLLAKHNHPILKFTGNVSAGGSVRRLTLGYDYAGAVAADTVGLMLQAAAYGGTIPAPTGGGAPDFFVGEDINITSYNTARFAYCVLMDGSARQGYVGSGGSLGLLGLRSVTMRNIKCFNATTGNSMEIRQGRDMNLDAISLYAGAGSNSNIYITGAAGFESDTIQIKGLNAGTLTADNARNITGDVNLFGSLVLQATAVKNYFAGYVAGSVQNSGTDNSFDTSPQKQAAFSATKGGTDQTGIVTNVLTKITFTTEVYDKGSYYDAPNSRWTPPAGLVRLTAGVYQSANVVDNAAFHIVIYKNGAAYKYISDGTVAGTSSQGRSGSITDLANGTDYYEVFFLADGAGNKTVSGTVGLSYFQGEMIRQ